MFDVLVEFSSVDLYTMPFGVHMDIAIIRFSHNFVSLVCLALVTTRQYIPREWCRAQNLINVCIYLSIIYFVHMRHCRILGYSAASNLLLLFCFVVFGCVRNPCYCFSPYTLPIILHHVNQSVFSSTSSSWLSSILCIPRIHCSLTLEGTISISENLGYANNVII